MLFIDVVAIRGLKCVAGRHVQSELAVFILHEPPRELWGQLHRAGPIPPEHIDDRGQAERIRSPRRFPHLLQESTQPHGALGGGELGAAQVLGGGAGLDPAHRDVGHRLRGLGGRHARVRRQAAGFAREGHERLAVRGQQRRGALEFGPGGVARHDGVHAGRLAQIGGCAAEARDRDAAGWHVEGVIGVPLAERAERGLAAGGRDGHPPGVARLRAPIGP